MSDALQSFLDAGTSFEGKVAFSGVVRIDGHFRGEARAQGTLVIGETGQVDADLDVETLIVRGRYRGNVTALRSVEVAAGGRVEGSVTTDSLVVADGAVLNAKVAMRAERAPGATLGG